MKGELTAVVNVRLFPNRPRVPMSQEGAAHLQNLLSRYNHVLENRSRFEQRWKQFWGGLRWYERALVRLCVQANTGSLVGQRIAFDGPTARGAGRRGLPPMRISSEVEAEYVAHLGRFYSSLTCAKDVVAQWCAAFGSEDAELRRSFAKVLQQEHGLVPWVAFAGLRLALIERGIREAEAQGWAGHLATVLHEHLFDRELACLSDTLSPSH